MPNAAIQQSPGDQRWQHVVQTMQRYDCRPEALIETLHAAQEAYGFLDLETLSAIATHLSAPPAKVFGVATFYNHFCLKPKGEHTLVVCSGTACHVKGNEHILQWVGERFHLAPGETTPDNRLSLVEVRCVGACALAPVIIPDGNLVGKKNFEEATALIEGWLDDGS